MLTQEMIDAYERVLTLPPPDQCRILWAGEGTLPSLRQLVRDHPECHARLAAHVYAAHGLLTLEALRSSVDVAEEDKAGTMRALLSALLRLAYGTFAPPHQPLGLDGVDALGAWDVGLENGPSAPRPQTSLPPSLEHSMRDALTHPDEHRLAAMQLLAQQREAYPGWLLDVEARIAHREKRLLTELIQALENVRNKLC